MAKQRKIVDYSRFHEIMVNLNPTEQWNDEWLEDIRDCCGNIKKFPYFKKIENNIDFTSLVESKKESLKYHKKNIEAEIEKHPGLNDPDYRERLNQCNKCLEMNVNSYERLEYLNFVYTNIRYLHFEDMNQYKKECEQLRQVIASAFIAVELNKNKLFRFFSSLSSIWSQLLIIYLTEISCWIGYHIIEEPSFFTYLFFNTTSHPFLGIPIILGILLGASIILFFAFEVLPILFIWLKIHEKDMEFVNTKLLLFDEPNSEDSFKHNSKKVIKIGVKTSIKLGILSRIFSQK